MAVLDFYLGARVRRAVTLFQDADPLCLLSVHRFTPAVLPPAAVLYKLESPRLQSAVQENTRSFVNSGRYIMTFSLANLIERVLSRAGCPHLADAQKHMQHSAKSSTCSLDS